MLRALVATGVGSENRSFFTSAAVTVVREQLEGVGVGESSMSAEEGEFAFGELLFPKISEFLDKRVFSRHDFGKIETEFALVNAPNLGLTGQMHDFGSVEQSFRRHTAAQNAEAADVLPAFNHDGFDASGTGRASGGVTGAAAADNSEVKIKMARCLAHVLSMGDGGRAGKGRESDAGAARACWESQLPPKPEIRNPKVEIPQSGTKVETRRIPPCSACSDFVRPSRISDFGLRLRVLDFERVRLGSVLRVSTTNEIDVIQG